MGTRSVVENPITVEPETCLQHLKEGAVCVIVRVAIAAPVAITNAVGEPASDRISTTLIYLSRATASAMRATSNAAPGRA
jgi:hypothetical protein